jgi:hypothetical protein
MCGSTNAQNQIQQQQMDAYKQAQDMLKEEYGHQQAIFGPMAAKFQSIFDLGPSQEGFSEGEKQNLETGVIEGTAQNYANAARAVNQSITAGGGSGMPSGAADELKLQTGLSSAQEKTREESEIRAADYQTGRENWQQAGSGLLSIAAGENPLGYEAGATSSGTAAADTANQIAQQQNSWINAGLGALGTAAGGWATGGFKV